MEFVFKEDPTPIDYSIKYFEIAQPNNNTYAL